MTLKEFHEARVGRIEDALIEIPLQLDAAIEALRAAESDLQSKRAELSQITDDIAATRLAMAEAPLPSDAEGLADQLRDQIIVQRQGQAAVLDAERVLDEARRAKATALASLANTEAELRQAEADLALAAETQARHQVWSTALTQEPLLGLPAAATAALVGEDFTAAEARVVVGAEAELPEKLRERSLERRALELGRVAGLEDIKSKATSLHDEQQGEEAGPQGETAALWTTYLTAEKTFGDYVRYAQQRFDQALANLGKINDSPPLTEEQKAVLHTPVDDNELAAARAAALGAEETRDEALERVELQQRELVKARLGERKNNVDVDPAVIDTLGDIPNILTELAKAEADLVAADDELDATTTDPTHRHQLDLWEAAAPDHVWDNLAAFVEAREILDELKEGPDEPEGTMTTAEDALAAKLATLDKTERTRKFLSAAIDHWQAGLDYANATARARIASRVRGDQ